MDCYQLQTISSFSFGQSSIVAEDYAAKLFKLGYQGGELGDINSISSFPYFDEAMNKNPNLIPIYGCIVNVEIEGSVFKGELIVETEQGYLNLVYLVNSQKDPLSLADLTDHSDGLVFVLKTEDPNMKDKGYLESNNQLFYKLSKVFKDFYFGIEIYSKEETTSIKVTRDFIESHSYEYLAFPKALYLDKEDGYKAYLMLNAIFEKKVITEDDLEAGGPFFVISPNVLQKVYSKQEVLNQSSLIKKIHFTFMKKRGNVLLSGEEDSSLTLRNKVEHGLNKEFNNSIPSDYQSRADYELGIIKQMGFSDYFLIVQDYVEFAKSSGIRVGPGRGSAAGSLVSYALGITKADPIKYGLYFERFLNPLRVTMPDIDIDFQDDRRSEVISYLRTKYGSSRVSLIQTYSTLQLRASIRNIGTIFNLPANRIDSLSKTISPKSSTFNEEYSNNYRFKKMVSDPYYAKIVNKAKLILNYPINTSIHASGVILSNKPISEDVPFYKGEEFNIAGFEYQTLEKMGYLKFDILALSNLTFLSAIEKNIIDAGLKVPDIYSDLNNPAAYDVLKTLKLTDIFQLDKPGMRRVVEQIKPNSIEDISAIIALYRPGPMENIPTYVKRRNLGLPFSTGIPLLDPILKDTYGIIIYQEQILSIANILAGFDGGKADLFRRAIAKKDLEKMNSLKDDFIKGCIEHSISKVKALEVFDLIVKFANYGFNKSHSYVYAFITYALAYYKGNYPWAFYLASLDKTSFGDEKALKIISEIHSFSYDLVNPSVNKSKQKISFKNHTFTLGLNDIRGINSKISDSIINQKEKNGPYKSLGDFFFRTDMNEISSRDLNTLIDAGALDEFGYSRKSIKDNLEDLKMASKFSTSEDDLNMPYMDKIEQKKSIDEFNLEFQALGAVLSFSLKDLIKGEKKYSTLYLVTDNPIFTNDKLRIEVNSGFIHKAIYYQGHVKVAKYDIISVNEDQSSHMYDQVYEMNKEEMK